MPKVRVYELAKELGLESTTLLATLNEIGEFVKSPSSIIEPPVARRLRDLYAASIGATRRPSPEPRQRHRGSQVRPLRPTSTTARPARNPPFPRRLRAMNHPPLSDPQTQAALIFGEAAVRLTSPADARTGAFRDGYDYAWQQHFIEHVVFSDFILNGLEPHEADLAHEVLLTGLRPSQLGSRLGDHTVLEWLRMGHTAERVAETLREVQDDPKSAHLVDEEQPPSDKTAS